MSDKLQEYLLDVYNVFCAKDWSHNIIDDLNFVSTENKLETLTGMCSLLDGLYYKRFITGRDYGRLTRIIQDFRHDNGEFNVYIINPEVREELFFRIVYFLEHFKESPEIVNFQQYSLNPMRGLTTDAFCWA